MLYLSYCRIVFLWNHCNILSLPRWAILVAISISCFVFLCEIVLPFIYVMKLLRWFTCHVLIVVVLGVIKTRVIRGCCVETVLRKCCRIWSHVLKCHIYCIVMFWEHVIFLEDRSAICTRFLPCCSYYWYLHMWRDKVDYTVSLLMWRDKVRKLLCACGETMRGFTFLLRT